MNNYITISLVKKDTNGWKCLDNVAELTVYQYRVDALDKEIVFKHNPQGKSCTVSYESLEILADFGPGRNLRVCMNEAQFEAFRALRQDR